MQNSNPIQNSETPDNIKHIAGSDDVVHGHKIGGDMVGGDKIVVGDMENVKGVAIGKGSTVVINENPRRPWLFVVGGLILFIILIGLVFLFRELNSRAMPITMELLDIADRSSDLGDDDYLRDVVVQDGFVWLATNNGLLMIDEEERRSEWVLQGANITSIAKDNQDNGQIWVGTSDGYLGRVTAVNGVVDVQTAEQANITAIFVDDAGQAWVADSDNGIWHYGIDGSVIDQSIPLPDDQKVRDLAVLRSSEQMMIWGLTDLGVYRWKDDQWTLFDDEDWMISEAVFYKVAVDRFGGSWFSHSKGVTYATFDEASLSRTSMDPTTCASLDENTLLSKHSDDIVIDDDWVWFITNDGIARKNLSDEGSDICENWQTYQAEPGTFSLQESSWQFDVQDDVCKSWLIALDDSIAYRLTFECERR